MTNEPCPYCLFDVTVTRWDHLVGLAVRCPKCGAHSGPSWSPSRLVLVAFASLVLNALVLFIVARPARALLLLVVYVASVASLVAASMAVESDALLFTVIFAILLGPTCIAGIEYYWHAEALRKGAILDLDSAMGDSSSLAGDDSLGSEAIDDPEGPRFLGSRDMERLRNEVEIAIFHKQDRVDLLAKLSYFVALLQAALALLNNEWLDVALSLLLIALAYTVKSHESRVFAVAYTLFGIAIAVEFIHRSINGKELANASLPGAVIILGLGMSEACFSLARLRRLREHIPLEPAAHLQDP